MWIVRFFIPDNTDVEWLYVLFSNFTMLGPIALYWLSSILIVIGWIDVKFASLGPGTYIRFALWVFMSFAASWYQLDWIDVIRSLYSGSNWTGTKQFEDVQSQVDTIVNDATGAL